MPNFYLSHKRVKVPAGMRIGALAAGEKAAGGRLRQARRDPCPRTARIRKEIWAGRLARERNAPAAGLVATGLTGAFGDEVFHGIFGGGTGPPGGQRAGAG